MKIREGTLLVLKMPCTYGICFRLCLHLGVHGTQVMSETVDIYLAKLRRLAVLFGGMSEKGLMCAFIAGIPESVEELL